MLTLQQLACACDIGRRGSLEVHAIEREAHELEQIRLVIHDQDGGPAHRSSQRLGSANTSLKMLPPPGRGSCNSVAPFVCASSRARNRPSPVPPWAPLKNGSKMRSACSGFTPGPRSITSGTAVRSD